MDTMQKNLQEKTNLESILITKGWCKDGISPAARSGMVKIWNRYFILFENSFFLVEKSEVKDYVNSKEFGHLIGIYDILTKEKLDVSFFLDRQEFIKYNAYNICKQLKCFEIVKRTDLPDNYIYMLILRNPKGKIDMVSFYDNKEEVAEMITEEMEFGRGTDSLPSLYNLETNQEIDWSFSVDVEIY